MPLYDFRCPHGHEFEKQVPIARMDDPVDCEGVVQRFDVDDGEVITSTATCALKAQRVRISFAKHNLILDHGMANNRDAAREGRYDPLNPSRRFMAKGRSWRK